MSVFIFGIFGNLNIDVGIGIGILNIAISVSVSVYRPMTTRTVVRECCKDDDESIMGNGKI